MILIDSTLFFSVYNFILLKILVTAIDTNQLHHFTAKGSCLLKKLTLNIKHDSQQVQLKWFYFFNAKNIWKLEIIIVMNSQVDIIKICP